jgi:hypothetical protein
MGTTCILYKYGCFCFAAELTGTNLLGRLCHLTKACNAEVSRCSTPFVAVRIKFKLARIGDDGRDYLRGAKTTSNKELNACRISGNNGLGESRMAGMVQPQLRNVIPPGTTIK